MTLKEELLRRAIQRFGSPELDKVHGSGFTSVAAAATTPKDTFIHTVTSGDNAVSKEIAEMMHDYAVDSYSHTRQTAVALRQAVNGTGLAAIDGRDSTVKDRMEKAKEFAGESLGDINLDVMFGGMDLEACDDCSSVTSPAAYLVELLEYLRNNNLQPDVSYAPGRRDVNGTILEKLLERRPDIGDLQLTCTNTQTVLPYLDLANEVMESFVVHLNQGNPALPAKIDVHNNTSSTCGNLLVEPENINDDAYRILAQEIHPLNKLPYHQPIDEIRIFLKYLKTSRHELLDTYGVTTSQIDATNLSRSITAEFHNLNELEYIALTGESYGGVKCYDMTNRGSSEPVMAQSQNRTLPQSVPKQWWQYWGYGYNDESHEELEFIKKGFLPRAGMHFSDLVELLKTEFLNPKFPRGKALTIFLSVHHGFKDLNDLAHMGEISKTLCQDLIKIMTGKPKQSSTPTTPALDHTQIQEWVEETFNNIGKLIVLNDPGDSESWQLDRAVLAHLDGSSLTSNEFLRLQQFVRLWRKMGWTIDETDKAVTGLWHPDAKERQNEDSTALITPHLLDQLVAVKEIQEITGLELLKVLTFWATISTRGKESLYSRLFLTRSLASIDSIFVADDYGNYFTKDAIISHHKTTIMAALELTKEGLNAIIEKKLMTPPGNKTGEDTGIGVDIPLNINTLSTLYRYSLMSKVLHVTPALLLQIEEMFGDFFESATHTLEFLENWKRMEDAGLTFTQLVYAFAGEDDPIKPLGPSKEKTLATIKFLYDGARAIDAAHLEFADEEAVTKEYLTEKLSLLYDDAFVEKVHEVLEHMTPWPAGSQQLESMFEFMEDCDRRELLAVTGVERRLVFQKLFLPYLKEQLTARFATSTLLNAFGLPERFATFIPPSAYEQLYSVAQVLPSRSYDPDSRLEELIDDFENGFIGYIVPASTDSYTFATTSTGSILLEINETRVKLGSGGAVALEGGRLYSMYFAGAPLSSLEWQKPHGPYTKIPESALLPNIVENDIAPFCDQLAQIATLVTGFDLSIDELSYLWLDSKSGNRPSRGAIWGSLISYLTLRKCLPEVKEQPQSLIALFRWASSLEGEEIGGAVIETLSKRLAHLLRVKEAMVTKLLQHFNWEDPKYFRNATTLAKLQRACSLAEKLAIDVEDLQSWCTLGENFTKTREVANNLRGYLKARFDTTAWETAIKPLHDELRIHQRDTLVAYLVSQEKLRSWGVVDPDSLFEFFLIDVQMGACLETSRIKQAISTVQLFVQRCLCGLEKHVERDRLDRKRWEWMRSYSTWEANRRVFLYPENWIEPSLRDNKSPVFLGLESDVLQKDLNDKTVRDAIKNYLSRVDEVANLHILSMYTDLETMLVHIFGRTRCAPYSFYYRVYSVKGKIWTPWEKMQVDMPYYADHVSWSHGGTLLKPMVWLGRLIVFIPEFAKQTFTKKGGETEPEISKLGDKRISDFRPQEYWEVRMGWTEYRNGKWTPKKLTPASPWDPKDLAERGPTDGVNDDTARRTCRLHFSKEESDTSNLIVALNFEKEQAFPHPKFRFSHGQLELIAPTTKDIAFYTAEEPPSNPDYYDFGTAIKDQAGSVYTHDAYVSYKLFNPITPNFHCGGGETPLYHEFISELLHQTASATNLGSLYDSFHQEVTKSSRESSALGFFEGTYHELKSPYALYNWELALHAPMLLIDRLASSHQYEKALKIAQYIFNPLDAKDPWKWAPFAAIAKAGVHESVISGLKANEPSAHITDWREAPYQPHAIARSRPVTYMKWIVLKYIKILIAAGDQFFRQGTLESVPLAIQYYILAAHLYGPPGEKVPKRGRRPVATYRTLQEKWDAFGDAVVSVETPFPYARQASSSQLAARGPGVPNILGTQTALYFCLPDNDKMRELRETIDDRLYKIRHSQDINGKTVRRALFELPLDPGALVAATTRGASPSNMLQDLNALMPNYRFQYILQKAFEMVQELKGLGAAFLIAKEKQDAEKYHLIRASYESRVSTMVLEMKKLAVEEADKILASLREARKGPRYRLQFYSTLIGKSKEGIPTETTPFKEYLQDIPVSGELQLLPGEHEEMKLSDIATDLCCARDSIEASAAVFLAFPGSSVKIHPFGVGTSLKIGAQTVGNILTATSRAIGARAGVISSQSAGAARNASFTRQLYDHVQAANSAGFELKSIDSQIAVQNTRIAVAKREMELQQKQIQAAAETEQFLRSKYSSEDLYVWQEKQLRELYYQTYTLTYELAKKAEKTFVFERGPVATSFIQGTWDANRDGLFSGEALHLGLKRLEMAYQEHRGYDYELTKHVSLRSINPNALLSLRELGSCDFEIPELLFDMDFPGHYRRRIKSVALSLPCIVGPYTGINCTLRLVKHSYRAKAAVGHYHPPAEGDIREDIVPINCVAISHAQNDAGVFELNFYDERYLPFEGAGADSQWRLELPKFRRFDYRSITDAVLHVKYTAVDGGDRLKEKVETHVEEELKKTDGATLWALFDVKNEFAGEFERFKGSQVIEMKGLQDRLPFFANTYSNEVRVKEIHILTSAEISDEKIWEMTAPKVKFKPGKALGEGSKVKAYKAKIGSRQSVEFGTWNFVLPKEREVNLVIEDLWVLARYTLARKSPA